MTFRKISSLQFACVLYYFKIDEIMLFNYVELQLQDNAIEGIVFWPVLCLQWTFLFTILF